MYLLSSDGRRHLLEFLRNLTPQVLLLSTTFILIVLWKRPDGWWLYLLLAIGTASICFMAILANADTFLDNGFSRSDDIAAERDRMKAESPEKRASRWQLLTFIWRHHRVTFFELLVTVLVVYGALAAILVAAATTAIKAFGS